MCWSSHRPVREVGQVREAREPRRRSEGVRGPVETAEHLRVSDAERQAVIEQLRHHAADGRLTLDEFEARVGEAMQARTGSQLRAVLRELPSLVPPASAAGTHRRRLGVPPVLVLAAVLVALSAAVGHVVIWPLFVFAFCGFGRHSGHGGRGRHHEAEGPEDSVTYA